MSGTAEDGGPARAEGPTWRLGAAPAPARWLGLAGLLPFVALAVAAHLAPAPWGGAARFSLAVYGVAILSFMGGCRWGFAAAGFDGEGPSWWRLAVSTVPALLGWAALTVGTTMALWASTLGLVALFAADVSLTRAGGAPAWWPALRLPLTVGAATSLLIGAAA